MSIWEKRRDSHAYLRWHFCWANSASRRMTIAGLALAPTPTSHLTLSECCAHQFQHRSTDMSRLVPSLNGPSYEKNTPVFGSREMKFQMECDIQSHVGSIKILHAFPVFHLCNGSPQIHVEWPSRAFWDNEAVALYLFYVLVLPWNASFQLILMCLEDIMCTL